MTLSRMTPMESLGRYLLATRAGLDLTLREVARKAKISPSFLSDIELGRRSFSAKTLVGLARVLRLDEAELAERVNDVRIAALESEIATLRGSR